MQQIIKSEERGRIPQEGGGASHQMVLTLAGPSEIAYLSNHAIEGQGKSVAIIIEMTAVEAAVFRNTAPNKT